MLDENDLREFLLIAGDDISEGSYRDYPRSSKKYIEGKAKAEAEAKAKKEDDAADKKAEDDAELDVAPGGKGSKLSMLDRVKAAKKGKLIDSSGKQRNDPKTEKDVKATNINRKDSVGREDTKAILPSATKSGKVSGKVPTALGRQAKDMLGPSAGGTAARVPAARVPAAGSSDKKGLSSKELEKMGIRGGKIGRRREVAADLAKMRKELGTPGAYSADADSYYRSSPTGVQGPDGGLYRGKRTKPFTPPPYKYKSDEKAKEKTPDRQAKDMIGPGAGSPDKKTPDRQAKDMIGPGAGSPDKKTPDSDPNRSDSKSKRRIAPRRISDGGAAADDLGGPKDSDPNRSDARKARARKSAPKPTKTKKSKSPSVDQDDDLFNPQESFDSGYAFQRNGETKMENKVFKIQSMREALEDVWKNGATVQENLRSSKMPEKGMRVLRSGKTMTGGRPAVIETRPKDPTSRLTNEEFALRDLTESMTDEEYELFEISANAALSLVPDSIIKQYAGGMDAAAIRAMAKKYGIDLSKLDGDIDDIRKGNFDNVTYDGKTVPSSVRRKVASAFIKGGGLSQEGRVRGGEAAAKVAGKAIKDSEKGVDVKDPERKVKRDSKTDVTVPIKIPPKEKESKEEKPAEPAAGSNPSKPKEVSTKRPNVKDALPLFTGKKKKEDSQAKDMMGPGAGSGKKSGVDTSDDDKASRKGNAVPKNPKEGGEELDDPKPETSKDKKKEPEKKKEDPRLEGGKYAYYEKDPKKRTKNSAMYMTQKGYDEDDTIGETLSAVDATSNFLSNISKNDTMYSWSLNNKNRYGK